MTSWRPDDPEQRLRDIERRLYALETAPRLPSLSVIGAASAPSAAFIPGGAGIQALFPAMDDLATGPVGPTVTVETGKRAIVIHSCTLAINGTWEDDIGWCNAVAGYAISGATDSPAAMVAKRFAFLSFNPSLVSGPNIGPHSAWSQTASVARVCLEEDLTPGLNTFTMKYGVAGGGGSLGNFPLASASSRTLFVLPLS